MLLALLVALTLSSQLDAQTNGGAGGTLPAACVTGSIYVKSGSSPGMYYCSATDTWTAAGGSSGSVPTGAIILIDTGTCPTGYAEATALSGKTIIGTVAANGNVGTTGGSDTIIPVGTVAAATFTGTAWSAPAIAWPVGVPAFTGSSANTSAVTAGTPAGTNGASATSGNCAATNLAIGTGALTACKATAPNLTVTAQVFTGSALGTHLHTLTATGTNAWPAGVPTIGAYTPQGSISAPTFTGTSFDNRSAYVYVIACKKT